MPHPPAAATRTPQRPLWQQLSIWAVALAVAFGLVVSSNAALTDDAPTNDAADAGITELAPPDPGPEVPADAPIDGDTAGAGDGDGERVQDEPVPQAPEDTDDPTAQSQLATLTISPRASRDGYSRDQFGRAWLDVDRNGCDTRNDILARDLDDTVVDSRCRVLSGMLLEPFTGDTIFFERGETTSALVHIDHVVALSNAWQTGAQQLTEDQRIAFANDPLNLIAVSGRLNQQKGDSDAASWLPPNSDYWCEYVARQVGVKAHYALWVTQAEHDQMARVLRTCPMYPALTPEDHRRYRPGAIPIP